MKVVNKDDSLVIRLEPEFKKRLKSEAKAAGLRLSEYARRVLSGEIVRPAK